MPRTYDQAIASWVIDMNKWCDLRDGFQLQATQVEVGMAFIFLYWEIKDEDGWFVNSSLFRDPDGGWRSWLDSAERDEIIDQVIQSRGA